MPCVKLSDPDAAWYPFKFQLGDIVESIHNSRMRGKIIDGMCDGAPKGQTESGKTIYKVELESGLCFNAEQLSLKKVPCTEDEQ